MKNSFWDSSVLKKFNSTSHFKLLSQLLTELKAYPLPRSKEITSKGTSKSRNSSNTRTGKRQGIPNVKESKHIEKSTTLYNNNVNKKQDNIDINIADSRFVSNNSRSITNESFSNHTNSYNLDYSDESKSFKDKLNDIDMNNSFNVN